MKRIAAMLLSVLLFLLCGCSPVQSSAQIAATTLPVYEFTRAICQGTSLTVTRLVTESVSCLHDYSLNVRQVRDAEAAEVLVISGAGLEAFMEDLLEGRDVIDASQGIPLITPETHSHHDHEAEEHGHTHEEDPHIWLDPANARIMAENICLQLSLRYPDYSQQFAENLSALTVRLEELESYGQENLKDLSCRELITFHDGFTYFAQAFDLEILEAVEEESGSEASARELIHLIEEVEHHSLPAIFTEANGSTSAASIIARETGASCYCLDMAMAGESYFDAMYHNIHTVKEALQ